MDPTLLETKLNIVEQKLNPIRRDYNYSCLDLLKEFDIPINIYYKYFLNNETFKLKNIWNHMIIKWNKMKRDLKEKPNKDFIKSNYSHNNYHQIHNDMNDESVRILKDNDVESD